MLAENNEDAMDKASTLKSRRVWSLHNQWTENKMRHRLDFPWCWIALTSKTKSSIGSVFNTKELSFLLVNLEKEN